MDAEIEELEEMNASELHARRLNAKEVLTPMKGGQSYIPSCRWNSQNPWRRSGSENIHLNPGSPGTRRRTKILQGKSDELHSPTQLQEDSMLDDEEATNDFWTVTGEFIYRHHVEHRVKLYVPKEESFPIPLKYIDVARSTNTSLDVILGENIEDCWNVDGEKELSDAWKGFTIFVKLKGKGVEMSMLWQPYCTDHRDLLSYVTIDWETVWGWHAQIKKCNQVSSWMISVKVVSPCSLTDAVRWSSFLLFFSLFVLHA